MNEILILLLILSVTVFFVWLHYYKKYQVDSYRQDIFTIRDRLFDYAATGNIAFDHPAYNMTRTYLNGTLRFTERSSILRLIIMKIKFNIHKSHFEKDFESRVKGLTNPQIEYISNALDQAVTRTVVYLGKKNILIVGLVYLVMCASFIRSLVKLEEFKEEMKVKYKNAYSDAVYNEGEFKYI